MLRPGGDAGKGDPLAHPRITVMAEASGIERDSPDYQRIRSRFLARHPKAALYADFADFRFLRLAPVSASLNGGFGKAYVLTREDLAIQVEEPEAWLLSSKSCHAHRNWPRVWQSLLRDGQVRMADRRY